MNFGEKPATHVAGTIDEEARDFEKRQLRFEMNEYCTDIRDKGVPLTRCYWNQSALLQSEWDQSILGKYDGIPWMVVITGRGENGGIPMGFAIIMEHGHDFISDGAFVVLLPYTKAKLHSKVAEYDQADSPERSTWH